MIFLLEMLESCYHQGMKIKIPPFLPPNGTIGITAPSFGCTTEPYASKFKTAVKILSDKGIKTITGRTVGLSDGKGISTAPETCARELEDFYGNNSVQAIISAGGGEMMCETASFIDFQKLKDLPPKWFMGYSDNTNFIFPLLTISHTASIYGPCISGLGKKWEHSERDAFDILCGTKNSVEGYDRFQSPEADKAPANNFEEYTYDLDRKKILTTCMPSPKGLVKAGSEEIKMEGILAGGCLDCLANMCGTTLDNVRNFNSELEDQKVLWVLESCDANPMELRRQVWHLKNAGWFEKAAGFLIGRPLASFEQEFMGVNQYNAVTDILSDIGVPVILDCDIGHIDPAMPLIMGAHSTICVKENEISVRFDMN